MTEFEQALCEVEITEEECLAALKTFKNSKSPGIDGLPAEFYKFFCLDLKSALLSSLNYALTKGELSLDQRRAVISLIPKKDKDRLFIRNWRPISLLTTDYKILTKCLSKRILKVIDKLISYDQTGYLKGRYIGENIRTVHDVITYLQERNLPGMMLLIDFEKAFDTVKWASIDKTLAFFNFGHSFRNWIKIIYNNIQSAVLNNGYISEFFKPQRGVRQGCPLSCYLFILVVEVLALKIRKNAAIKGISVAGREIKISQLADDTTLFINGVDSIEPVVETLRQFRHLSGLKANIEKTKFYNIGTRDIDDTNMHGFRFSKDIIRLLGLTITKDEVVSEEQNFRPKLKAMETILKHWSRRKLSLKGKITVINALIVSLIVYPATVLETPNSVLHEINDIIYAFLWDGKRPKVAAKVIENTIRLGGLKMPNIFLKVKAWQLSWLRRTLKNPENSWVCVLNSIIHKVKLRDLILGNLNKNDKFLQSVPTFYRKILCTLYDMKQVEEANHPANQSLWLNKNVTVEGESIFWKEWHEKGITFIRDIIDEHDMFYDEILLTQKYSLNTNFLRNLQLRQSIPIHWRMKLNNANFPPLINQPTFQISNSSGPITLAQLQSRQIYWFLFYLNKTQNNEPKCISKWSALYENEAFAWDRIFLLPYKICKNTRLQSLQYRLLHRIITCNHWLFNAKIKASPNCETCKCDDTLEHFFVQCDDVREFWTSLNRWWNRRTSMLTTPYTITDIDILFGISTVENVLFNLNFVLLFAKKYIHDCKMTNQNIAFLSFLVLFRQELYYEEQICIKNQCEQEFIDKWAWLYDQL